MPTRPVKPGDPLKGNLTANWFNKVSRKVVDQPDVPDTGFGPIGEYFILDEANTVTIEQYEPVIICDQANAESDTVIDKQTVMLKAWKPGTAVDTEGEDRAWAISQDTVVGNTTPGRLIATGITWAKFKGISVDDHYVKLNHTTNTLESTSDVTKAVILSFNGAPGDISYGLILLGSGGGGSALTTTFTLTADLASGVGATATATFADASTGVVVNTGKWRTFIGATGMAILVGGNWLIIHVDEPGDLLAELGPDPEPSYSADPREANAVVAASPTPTVITQYPHSLYKDPGTSVANPLKLYGESGDKVILKWNRTNDAYMVYQVIPAQQRMFWGELAADAPAGLIPTISVTPTDPLTPGTMPADPVDADDLFDLAHNAKEGDRCLVLWDNNTGSYKILETIHTTTHFLGTLFEDFDDAPATFKVDHVRSFNGNDPNPATEIEVENRWNWRTGLEGDEIEVAWDPTTETWYPIQIKPYENFLPLYVY